MKTSTCALPSYHTFLSESFLVFRLLVLIRLVALAFFLMWRIKHQNDDAIWLWGMSIVCELWFAFSWVLDQLPKLCPINRATDLSVLKEKFETPTPNNPTGKSDLPGIDIFVSTADPEKEPVLVTSRQWLRQQALLISGCHSAGSMTLNPGTQTATST